jgi:methylisocitrate lyase
MYSGAMTPRTEAFRRLHQSGCFVIPNPWDVGSARALVSLGFAALATTSAGAAWAAGRPDHGVTLEDALAHARTMAAAVDVPVSVDFEDAFAVAPEGVAANVGAAAATGIAGLSVEDSSHDPSDPLLPFDLSVDRMRAAREAIDHSGTGIVLTGRAEGFIVGRPDLDETIRRLTAYSEAGADCLYAPGLRQMDHVAAIVRAVAPKPVNVLVGGDFTTVEQLAALGVRRISVGGALARTAWTGFLSAAREIATGGTFKAFGSTVSHPELNALFEPHAAEGQRRV